MKNVSQTFQGREETEKLLVFFLYDDEEQSVYVKETEDVDLLEIIQHLNLGGSVFITHRRKKASKNHIVPDNV